MRFTWKYLKKYKLQAILAPLFKFLEATFELIVPLIMARMIDVGIANADKPYVFRMCGLLILMGLIGLVCACTAQFFAARAATWSASDLREDLFEHIQQLSFTETDAVGTDTLITRLTSDINQVQSGINMVLRLLLRSPFIVVGAMVMAFTVNVRAALIFVVMIPALSVIIFSIMKKTMPMYKQVQSRLDGLLQNTRENLTGARVIRAFGREEDEIRKYEQQNLELTSAQERVGGISALMNPLTFVAVNLAIIALLWSGALQVDTGILTQGQVIALLNYMNQILIELVKFANLIVLLSKALACAARVEEAMNIPVEKNILLPETVSAESAEVASRNDDAVVFNHVSLQYGESGEAALEDITFTAKVGETIGIIGGTGSGKSSVVQMIPRFYPATQGTVQVLGKDVKSWDAKELREKIGMVFQKAELFRGTIAENLRWGNESASDEELWAALRCAQGEDFVRERQGGLEAMIEQSGRNLSGGQKQRMTIARALVAKPEILILDDSASALDFATDLKLRTAIRELAHTMTVFIVSQRTASIREADRILVLDDGRIVGNGTHEQLLESNEVYQEIYYSQFPKDEAQTGAPETAGKEDESHAE